MKLAKVTSGGKGEERRWYDDACGTAHALELVGERWSLLIVRELMFGGRRFGELRASLSGVSANVLTQRLGSLEAAGIVRRRTLPPPASAQVYELTAWGYEAEPAIQALGRWAARSPEHDPTLPLSAASMMLSLRTMLGTGASPAGIATTLRFVFGAESFVARLADDALPITRDDAAVDADTETDATVDTDPVTLASIVYGKRPVAEAEADGSLRLTGDRAALARFAALFDLPPKAVVE